MTDIERAECMRYVPVKNVAKMTAADVIRNTVEGVDLSQHDVNFARFAEQFGFSMVFDEDEWRAFKEIRRL